jgi:hypothetical protein
MPPSSGASLSGWSARRAQMTKTYPTPSREGPLGPLSLHRLGVGYGRPTRSSGVDPYPTVGRRKENVPGGPPGLRAGQRFMTTLQSAPGRSRQLLGTTVVR